MPLFIGKFMLTLDAAHELCHSTQMKIDAVDVAKVRTVALLFARWGSTKEMKF